MRKKGISLRFLLIAIIALVVIGLIVSFAIKNGKKDAQTQAQSAPALSITPDVTQEPSGIYIVDPPANAYSYTDPTPYVPDGITVVDAPAWVNNSNANTFNGVYVIDTPGPGGVYVVDTPNPGGVYVIETPTPGGGGGGTPTGTTIASGSFSSNSGTGLNITVSYNAVVTGPTAVDVTMSASLSHGQLSSTSTSLSFTCAGQSGSVSAPSINGSGSTFLGSRTFTVNVPQGSSQSCSLSASWLFNGTYSGTHIDSVSASNVITLSR